LARDLWGLDGGTTKRSRRSERAKARVVAVDINHDAAHETAAIIRDEEGTAVPVAADVTDSADVRAAVQAALTQ
jgi:NAD(P)-dependent dehydrogenase (short-subunit alcohol dehydrogenase family)